MTIVTQALLVMVALLHIYFLILEMFYWDKPMGMKIFRTQADFAHASKALAANQGLYNGFLAAGLLCGLYLGTAGNSVSVFFLLCVITAGIFGAWTVNRRIFYIQALPAIITLAMLIVV